MPSVSPRVQGEGRFALGAIALLLCPVVAAAQDRAGCANPRVRVDGRLQARWVKPVQELCETLGDMPDADPTASLRIAPIGDELLLEVTLGDGRVARRRLDKPEDLPFTVEALLLVPAAAPPAVPAPATHLPPAPPAPPAPAPVHGAPAGHGAPASEATARDNSGAHRAAEDAAPAGLPVQGGASLSGRLAGSPTYVSAAINGYAGIRSGLWLFALGLRWEPNQWLLQSSQPPGFEMSSVATGFTVSRRTWETPALRLDLGVSTFLVVETQSFEPGGHERTDTDPDVRLGLMLRGLLGRPAPWCLSPSLEADVSPLRVRSAQRALPELPTLPSFSVAVGFGIVWEEP